MPDVYQNLELLQWSCDHVSTSGSDSFFSLLDFVTQQFSSTVTSFSFGCFAVVRGVPHYRSEHPLSIGPGSPPYPLYSYRTSTKRHVQRLLNSVHWIFLTSLWFESQDWSSVNIRVYAIREWLKALTKPCHSAILFLCASFGWITTLVLVFEKKNLERKGANLVKARSGECNLFKDDFFLCFNAWFGEVLHFKSPASQ